MAVSARTTSSSSSVSLWLPTGIIALVALVGGLMLPQVMPGTASPPKNTPTTTVPAKNDKNDWTYVPPSWPEPPNHQAVFLRLGLGTVSVLALCVATLWCCKRWLRSDPPPAAASAQMRCLESLALGNRCQVHLVRIGNRSVLVGADAGGIKTIVPLHESFAQALDAVDETAPA